MQLCTHGPLAVYLGLLNMHEAIESLEMASPKEPNHINPYPLLFINKLPTSELRYASFYMSQYLLHSLT